MDLIDVIEILSRACDEAGSQAEWGRLHGFSGAYVSDVLRGRRLISRRMLTALKLRLVKGYARIEE